MALGASKDELAADASSVFQALVAFPFGADTAVDGAAVGVSARASATAQAVAVAIVDWPDVAAVAVVALSLLSLGHMPPVPSASHSTAAFVLSSSAPNFPVFVF